MKKHLLIAGLLCVAIIPPAAAVTKCVALNTSMTCNIDAQNGNLDWSGSCSMRGGPTTVSGIAACSSQNGGTAGKLSATLPVTLTSSGTADDNKYCWCKMTSPAVSQWVYASSFSSNGMCINNCATACRDGLNFKSSFPQFLPNMISQLSD